MIDCEIIYDNPKDLKIYFLNRELCKKMVKKGIYKQAGKAKLKDGRNVTIYNNMWGYVE